MERVARRECRVASGAMTASDWVLPVARKSRTTAGTESGLTRLREPDDRCNLRTGHSYFGEDARLTIDCFRARQRPDPTQSGSSLARFPFKAVTRATSPRVERSFPL